MNSGGLIEAGREHKPAHYAAMFPPVNSGGLIEASIRRELRYRCRSSFRR